MNAVIRLKAWVFGKREWSLSALSSCEKYTAWVALTQKSFAHSRSADGMIATLKCTWNRELWYEMIWWVMSNDELDPNGNLL